MNIIKTSKQIKSIKQGGKILAEVMEKVIEKTVAGISTGELNEYVKELILKAGGIPSFEGYTSGRGEIPFPSAICASLNDQVVHCPASFDVVLQEGDILSIDMGMQYQGCFTDMAKTIPVGNISKTARSLIKATNQALELAIKVIRPGNTIADIGKVIEKHAKKSGYGVIRDLVGHGVGCAVHEDPKIPNFYLPENDRIVIKQGMVLAIEPMLTEGGYQIECSDDGWTIATKDGKLSAHSEHTVIVTENNPYVATRI